MRLSRLFSQTLRDQPADAESPGHSFLVRAGFIRQLANGIYAYLPLARRSLDKIENIMREEINAIGGQEITMPFVNPAEIWKETGRWYQIGSEMGRFKDKNARDMVLAMTHEEIVADLVCKEIHSYRQLPVLIYHIQTKWRDDPRPRAGLIRVREFTMKDSYSLDATEEGLDKQYRAHYQAYFNIFNRCHLPTIAVKADVGMMGGQMSHEFMYLNPIGEDTIVICHKCRYTANRQIARFQKSPLPPEKLKKVARISTPGARTIDELSTFLNVPKAKIAKAILLVATITEEEKDREHFVFAVVRGDMELSETKLTNILKAKELRPALDSEIQAVGAAPGYASPVNLREPHNNADLIVVVDDVIPDSPNLIAGANDDGYHLRHVNYGRDFKADIVTDIVSAPDGGRCPDCGELMLTKRGIEVGNIFKLGTRYSDALGCTFLDKDGKEKAVIMGSYGIGSGRLLGAIAEEHNDKNGFIWPITVAPYQVHLLELFKKNKTGPAVETAKNLYRDLQAAGIEVLYDDRDESPGVKFNDVDLIGVPIRLTVSQRSLREGGVEWKLRRSGEKKIIAIGEAVEAVKSVIAHLNDEIEKKVTRVDFAG